MERLTIKEEWVDYAGFTNDKHNYRSCSNYSVEKLGQLEDIEEELGIDLITLFKANKVYFKYFKESNEILESVEVHFDITNKILRAYHYPEDEFGTTLGLSSYGELWSLRKEDLQDED